jgi:uncharacterized membrane protein YkoI
MWRTMWIRHRPAVLAGGLLGAAAVVGAVLLNPVAGWAQQPGAGRAGAPLLQPTISLERAQQIALADHDGAVVREAGLEFEGEALVYEITLSGGIEVVIDASSGAVLMVEQDDDERPRRARDGEGRSTPAAGAPLLQPTISLEQAQRTALAANADAAVEEVELEFEDGRLVYEVELSNDVDVEIDAVTGEILESEHDHDDQDDQREEDRPAP